jgi:hypothetical protein
MALTVAKTGERRISGCGLLVPGLFLIGAGQGLCITSVTSTVLSYANPSTAGTR